MKDNREIKNKDALQKYITFSLGEEEYGVPVLQVHEIVKMDEIIKIPHSFDYFMGLMDIRGKVIPVIDLKKKLGIQFNDFESQDENTENSRRAIIIDAYGKRIGLAVDRVSHVNRFPPESIDSGPPAVKSSANRYIAGVGKYKDQFVVLMSLSNLFTPEEVDTIFGKDITLA